MDWQPSCPAAAWPPCNTAAPPFMAGHGVAAMRNDAAPCRGSARQSNTPTITRDAFMPDPERWSRRAVPPVPSSDSRAGILVHCRRRCPARRLPVRPHGFNFGHRSRPRTDAARGIVFRGEYPLGVMAFFPARDHIRQPDPPSYAAIRSPPGAHPSGGARTVNETSRPCAPAPRRRSPSSPATRQALPASLRPPAAASIATAGTGARAGARRGACRVARAAAGAWPSRRAPSARAMIGGYRA